MLRTRRSPVVSEAEGPAMISKATAAAKRQHKQALVHALQQVAPPRARRLSSAHHASYLRSAPPWYGRSTTAYGTGCRPQVERENAELQQQFTAQLPRLQAANEEIASCMGRMEQVRLCCWAGWVGVGHVRPQRVGVTLVRSVGGSLEAPPSARCPPLPPRQRVRPRLV